MSWEKKEECGVVGIISKKGKPVAHALYRSLIALQHRGQDAAGIAILNDGKINEKRGIGLVSEIFTKDNLGVKGNIGIGHTRYPTTGRCLICDVQPTVIGNFALAHNGHIANYGPVRKELEGKNVNFSGTVDSELIARVMEDKKGSVEEKVEHVMSKLDGAYSAAAITDGKLVLFRDKHGIRPFVYGENEEYFCFASESVALDINGMKYLGNVGPGEIAVVENGKVEKKKLIEAEPRYCMFEWVYFSRPDSLINEKHVFMVRKALGKKLAEEHPVKADVVVPVPDTARTAASAFSEKTGIKLEEGLIKNRYIGRTFIMPSQEKRKEAVRMKLNVVKEIVDGKKVVLVDDSIVRGTTLKEIVRMVRNSGAKEVHVRITCPPIRAPCFYGVDMSTFEELIANNKTIEETAKFLGVESLGYISIEGLKNSIGLPVCSGCLDQKYPTDYAKKMADEKKGGDYGCG